jgi:alcohol dehydrogenase class IV
MALIGAHLRTAYHEPADAAAREGMMLGATQAGLAFTNASVALVHGMSRPIGAHFHVPHGLSNAMLLPAVTRFSIEAAPARYAEAARCIGFATPTDADGPACARLVAGLEALNKELLVPSPPEYGIDEGVWNARLDLMAEQALASGSPNNNPRVPDKAEIIALYHEVWRGAARNA